MPRNSPRMSFRAKRGVGFSETRGPAQLPRGFSFAAAAAGVKKSGLDFGLIASDRPATAAGVFTTNCVQAAPVQVSRQHLERSGHAARAVVINSGNANCATGPAGLRAAEATTQALARALGCRVEEVLVCSTGVIGVPLPVEQLLRAVPALVRSRRARPEAFARLTRAIMTTDTRPKWAEARCRVGGKIVRLLGCAKGAGMIHPRMATMLAFVLTDAAVRASLLSRALGRAAAESFNTISVDGDTSTNDTLIVLASGASGAPESGAPESGARAIRSPGRDYRRFARALVEVCRKLALAIVADGEGADRVVEIEVSGAASNRAARRVAETIATSPLVKTALAGADPNWGRILAAAGRAGIAFDPGRVSVWLAGTLTCRKGAAYRFDEAALHRKLLKSYVPIVVRVGSGRGRARLWTCDFTGKYVDINASYRS
jgi:glutamate N-acetyltransferase / amino-acid N-acetyltransferase